MDPKTRLWLGLVFLLVLFLTSPAWSTDSQPRHFPTRVISLSPLLSENIFLLGAGDRLMGNTVYCQRPEAARRVEKIGSVQELGIEKIVSLRPDLVLSINLNPKQQVDKLRDLGLQVETFSQPASFPTSARNFSALGNSLASNHGRRRS